MSSFLATLAGLSSAEQFFDLLGVPYDGAVLNVSRLHILKGFHDQLDFATLETMADGEAETACRAALAAAYRDFAAGQGTKTLKVFRQAEPGFVPLSDLLGGGRG
jgi:nitrogenase-stabilizing/protective protein